jgi:O-antigen/teichoic acid export membrane protein
MADQLVVSGGNFLSMLIAARTMEVSDFGRFSLTMMMILFAANLHRAVYTQPLNVLGVSSTICPINQRMHVYLRTHPAFAASAGLLLFVLSLATNNVDHTFPFALLAASTLFIQELVRRYWYTTGDIKKAFVADCIGYGTQVVFLLSAATLDWLDPRSAFASLAIGSGLSALQGLWHLRRKLQAPASLSRLLIFKEQWPMTKWLLLTVLAVWGAGQVYPFLMTPLGPQAVATFSASRTLLNVIGPAVQSLGNVIPSHAAALLKNGQRAEFDRHLRRTMTWVLGCAMLLVVLMGIGAPTILALAYGGKYDGAANILRILSIGSGASLIATGLGAYSLAAQDSKSGFYANLLATAVTFSIGLWLIAEYREIGAAVGTSLSLVAAAFAQGVLLRRKLLNGAS